MQGQMMGARAAISGHTVFPEYASGNDTRGVELPPEPVLPTRVISDGQAGDYIPAWRALLPINGSKCQAPGVHINERER